MLYGVVAVAALDQVHSSGTNFREQQSLAWACFRLRNAFLQNRNAMWVVCQRTQGTRHLSQQGVVARRGRAQTDHGALHHVRPVDVATEFS
jgi:hypothetical protein